MKKKMFVVIGVVTALLVFFSVMLLVKKPGIGNMQTSSDAEKTEDSFSYSRESSPGVLSDPDADALLSTLGSMGEELQKNLKYTRRLKGKKIKPEKKKKKKHRP